MTYSLSEVVLQITLGINFCLDLSRRVRRNYGVFYFFFISVLNTSRKALWVQVWDHNKVPSIVIRIQKKISVEKN